MTDSQPKGPTSDRSLGGDKTRSTQSRAGIKGIAEALGVSIGTVDRALHARPGISPSTRERVLRMAEQLDYRPNMAARYLKSQKQLRISVQLPLKAAHFFDPVREGIRKAAAPFEPAVDVQFRSYPRLAQGDAEVFERSLDEGVDGIIICPGHPDDIRPYLRQAVRKKIPVVCVASDAPGPERLTTVSADPFTGGAMVGELFTRFLPAGGEIAYLTGDLSTVDHAEKLRGFKSSLRLAGAQFDLAAIVEAHDEEAEAEAKTAKILNAHPELRGVYVGTANSVPVLRTIKSMGRSDGLTVITTDLFSELIPWIRAGAVTATMYQRPVAQGRIAFEALYRYLLEGASPPSRTKLVPMVVMRSNLDLVLERFPVENDVAALE